MIQYRQNSGIKKIFSSPIFFLAMLFFSVIAVYGAFKAFSRRLAIESDVASLNKKIENLKKENESILNSLKAAASKEGIEKEAKARFNLKNEGENVVVVVPKEQTKKSEPPPQSILLRIKNYFNSFFAR
jgi:cell division protein FtsL